MDPNNAKLFVPEDSESLEFTQFPNAILREAEKTYKESGVNSLCLVEASIQIPIGSRPISSPLWLVPLVHRLDKIRQIHRFEIDEDGRFLNPYVSLQLENLGVRLAANPSEEEVREILVEKGLVLDPHFRCIGNFHHHRYQVIRELEELLALEDLAPQTKRLFGFSDQDAEATYPLHKGKLFPSDIDHDAVFERFAMENTVVQGPPGTGKSQVLSNVVAKALASGYSSIVVSEKRAALDVIRKKLGQFGLDKLCFIATSDQLSHHFLSELKSTWDYFEAADNTKINNLRLSEQYLDNLQMTLDLLSQEELIGGVSFHTFQAACAGLELDRFAYNGDTISVQQLLDKTRVYTEIYSLGLAPVLGSCRPALLERERLLQVDRELKLWLEQLKTVQRHFSLATFYDLQSAMRKAALCQVYENELFKRYAEIFQIRGKARKKFLKLRKAYQKITLEIEQERANLSHWKTVPSMVETESLLKQLGTGNFFERRKARIRWKQLTHLDVHLAPDTLQKHLYTAQRLHALSQLMIEFCALGLDDPQTEIDLIYGVMHMYTEAQWLEIEAIPASERTVLTEQHQILNRLYTDLRHAFEIQDSDEPEQILHALIIALPTIIARRDLSAELNAIERRSLRRNPDYLHFRGEILRSHAVQFSERFPAFSNFSAQQIHDKVATIIRAEEEEFQLFAQEIEALTKARFDHYHALLNEPARKLSDEEKDFKARLRKGKSLLVKEFSKTRSHPSLRELYRSDARLWIQLLKPVWLSNPVQLAKCFPMEEGLFDLAIFDEASQIPLQNALGTLQRSRRALVAGDEHQMGPSSYFKAGPSEAMDLLHQASYNWVRIPLRHHYRSSHPDLIRFSNHHFYSDELRAYPAAFAEVPLRYHFVKEGRFIDRKNICEAQALAKHISSLLKNSHNIGIVAFSEEQLQCIRECLNPADLDLIQSSEFPGFFKSLENVQGDECEHLVISFAYAPNEENEFHLRFGPMNTSNGRKRLNVLLTRAQHSIDFFASVHSSAFSMSDNESVNLLRAWLQFIEQYSGQEQVSFPYGLHPTMNGTSLTFSRIQETLPKAREIVNMQRVLEARAWKLHYS